MIDDNKILRIYKLAKSLGLPLYHKDFTNKELISKSLNETIAHRNGDLNLPITSDIGKYVFINEFSDPMIDETINFFKCMKDKF